MDWPSTALQEIPGHPELQHMEGYDDYYYDTFTGLLYSKENGGYRLNPDEPMFSHDNYQEDLKYILSCVTEQIDLNENHILLPSIRSYIY
tara:strand:+ start:23 stop:292 length:270 start_codon:yes stop_codon:yes gene_type:complete